ncbi:MULTISPECIES: hypothetical protein [Rhodomicrobium]|uniref:hypothetical protein n=1 Tax=Rhodomicrobium TaxID=1068 RepID=UPI000F74B3D2|nr:MULTISPECIES: hypothetical protein [Rhodomicrobium]
MRKLTRRDENLGGLTNDKVEAQILVMIQGSAEPMSNEEAYGYIENMASELTRISAKMENRFLAYLLHMAAEEARSSKARGDWTASAA